MERMQSPYAGKTTAAARFLSVQQVAGLLGVSDETVRRTIVRGELPAIRAGARQLRIPEADLAAYLVRQREQPDP
jgi:excisionase family DNA binding protein